MSRRPLPVLGGVHETLHEEEEEEEQHAPTFEPSPPRGTAPPSPQQQQVSPNLSSGADSEDTGSAGHSRPGPRPLYARHTPSTAPPAPGSDAGGSTTGSATGKTPAAGAGSRVRPNPVPKDSSSLRHISFRSRLASIPPSQGELEEPAAATFGRVKGGGGAQYVCEDDEEEQDAFGEEEKEEEAAHGRRRRGAGESWTQDVYGEERHRRRRSHRRRTKPAQQRGVLSVSSSSSSSATDTSGSEADEDQGTQTTPSAARDSSWLSGGASGSRSALPPQLQREKRKPVRRAPWHRNGTSADGESPPLLAPGGMLTPGIHWPQTVNTPLGTPPEPQTPEVEPRIRLEWQTMLESVLASEVLRSETKRITSVDAAVATREEQMYARWLDIRASLRGRGHLRGAVEAEEKRLTEGWGVMVRDLIKDVKACRPETPPEAPPSNADAQSSATPASDAASVGDAAPRHTDDTSLAAAVAASAAHTAEVMAEVGALLARVDSAEEQFPSLHKMEQVVPEWAEPALQAKLSALYSWYNVASALQLQLRILQQWTGSETLAIETTPSAPTEEGAEVEAPGTFVERILKANSLQGTFEKRTLSALNALVLKAKRVILTHHEAFSRMALPSFEPLLVQLINFPTRLVLGALRLRLDYAGKLREPSLLIVDSLTDDLRAALALACRVRLQYSNTMVPEPESGWDLPPCIGEGYDATLREALRFFFKLLNFKLKGAVFFKETEILEPEWRFLSTAAHVIEGGDVIVARSVTKIVNKLFARIVTYFERELSAPSTRRGEVMGEAAADAGTKAAQARGNPLSGPSGEAAGRGPSTAGGLTRGKVRMTLEEKVKWIHAVFENVRIRSRKLLGFARDIRNRLENAAEYDLGSLATAADASGEESAGLASETKQSAPNATPGAPHATMDLNAFLQTLINAGYFLVLTATFEPEGVYLIAEPSLHDKPELIQELFCRCMRRRSDDEDTALAAEANATAVALAVGETPGGPHAGGDDDVSDANDGASAAEDDEAPRYLLLLSPRDAFMWTGRIMTLKMPHIGVDLKERRLRLIADGPKRRLEMCKAHFYAVFREAAQAAQAARAADSPPALSQSSVPPAKGAAARGASAAPEEPAPSPFPLEVINETMAHMSAVQAELRKVNKGVYMLSDTVIRAVPSIRRNLRGRRLNGALSRGGSSDEGSAVTWSKCDELIQNCFNMGAEQGFRSLPFIESDRLRGQMTLALARLSIDWVAFICDDCVPGERKTFKWAVAALENAMQVTRSENIFQLSEDDFGLMRTKVASCMALLISQFDILGARSSVAKAQEEQERLKREHTERDRVRVSDAAINAAMQASPGLNAGAQASAALDAERKQLAAKMVLEMGGAGAPPMLNRHDSGMQATEERWVQKVMEWDAARQAIEAEQRLIGRVLDDARPEDRGLQFLASSSSRIQIRWQQGRFIGGGTFGTVYLAVNLDSGGLMAVKEIRFQDISSSPQLYKQIKDEMNVMEMLSHPNIVEYYGIEVHRDKVYIFEEYCEGGSLAQLLEHGRIEDEVVIQVYTLQMLDGLVYLHSKGVVHRDIKPDNILLDHLGVIKFVDFGAAKILAKNSRTIQRSRRGGGGGGGAGAGAAGGLPIMGPDGKMQPGAMASLQGTPMYMSPEVIKGETRGRRGAMDVWSLGCVVLEFATGRRPWSQLDNEWAIMFHIGMAQQHPPLPEQGQLSESGIDFIRQCLIIDPYERPSAAEMRAHPWIQGLIEELKAANEEAAGADAVTSSDFSSPMVHANDSSAGVAALAATPGTRSINGFNFGRPTLNAGLASMHRSEAATSTSSFSRLSLGGADTPGVAYEASEAETDEVFAEDAAIHVPSAQQHEQEAWADRAYDEEKAERHRLNHAHLPSLAEAAQAVHEEFPEESA